MRFSFWYWKKPIDRPSGDQKGSAAPSVPGRRVVPSVSIERIEIPPSLENSFDVRATLRPSGDTARDAPKSAPAEDTRGKTRRDGGDEGFRRARYAIARAPMSEAAATAHARR